jgi:gas vesicle protein
MSNRIYYSQEAERRANQEKVTAILLFLLLGLGAGAILAILFAPKSGESIRGEIEDRVHDGVKTLEKEVADLRKRIDQGK